MSDLAAMFERYDAFLIDQFGVLVDGARAYQGAAAALARLAQMRKPVVILSNSGKRSAANCARLTGLGFARAHFITVQSSGELAYRSLKAKLPRPDIKAMTLVRAGDPSPLDGLGFGHTNDPHEARLLVIVSRDLAWSRADYQKVIGAFVASGGRCLCVNPDLHMLTPDGIDFSAGTIAAMVEQAGGTVEWFGKPHPAIYDAAIELLPPMRRSRILCIGDSPEHDIQGGRNAGCATALVRTGVHQAAYAGLSDAQLKAHCDGLGLRPDHILQSFTL